jgi:hypothetical protein
MRVVRGDRFGKKGPEKANGKGQARETKIRGIHAVNSALFPRPAGEEEQIVSGAYP